MTPISIIDLLKETGALLTNDHFVLTSGMHSPIYINKDALYLHTEAASTVGKMFAEAMQEEDIQVVAAPALGGIILSQWTAHRLSQLKGTEVLSTYTEKTPEKDQIFTRGYDKVVKGKNVLVIEDLTTTGNSVKKVISSVRSAGGVVSYVGVMVNRNPEGVNEKTLDAPFFSLGELKAESYDENNCPLCKQQIPINITVGHGKKFL